MIEVNHRRAGKSKNAINFILAAAMQRVGNYFHTFPELTQARRAIWNNIDKEGRRYLDHIPKALMKKPPNNSEMRIELINGSMIQLGGADRYDALMGGNPAGIIFDEYSLQNPFAWHYLAPILTENGGWAKFVYTPRGMNHGYELYNTNIDNPDWFVQKLDITQTFQNDGTPVITEAQVEERRRSGMPEELIQQEFYVSFNAALANSFYTKEFSIVDSENRIRDFDFHPVPVYSAWDLGYRDNTSIWLFQPYQGKLWLVDYYENCKEEMGHYIDYIHNFIKQHHLKLGANFAPHDIKVHEWGNGRSRVDMAAEKGFYFTAVKKLDFMDGINSTRALFNRFVFHKTRCKLGINNLKQYTRNEDGSPKHDFASHCADALRYLAVGWDESYINQNMAKNFTMEKWHP